MSVGCYLKSKPYFFETAEKINTYNYNDNVYSYNRRRSIYPEKDDENIENIYPTVISNTNSVPENYRKEKINSSIPHNYYDNSILDSDDDDDNYDYRSFAFYIIYCIVFFLFIC